MHQRQSRWSLEKSDTPLTYLLRSVLLLLAAIVNFVGIKDIWFIPWRTQDNDDAATRAGHLAYVNLWSAGHWNSITSGENFQERVACHRCWMRFLMLGIKLMARIICVLPDKYAMSLTATLSFRRSTTLCFSAMLGADVEITLAESRLRRTLYTKNSTAF